MSSKVSRQKAEARLRDDNAPDEKSLKSDRELQEPPIEMELQKEAVRRIQDELKITQNKYFDLFNLAPVSYFLLDEQGNIVELNLTAAQMLQHDQQYLAGRPILPYLAPDSRPLFLEHLNAVYSTQKHQQCEVVLYQTTNNKQQELFIKVDSVAVKGEDAQWLCWVTMTDISQQKALETEILKTQKLESVGLLAGGIAHDFNNILIGILGNISLARIQLEKLDADSSILELLQQAEDASLRAKDLTFELLTFASGGNPVKETVAIDELIQKTSRFVLRGSNVRPVVNIDSTLWPVEVDQGQIHQVLNNLLINAKQAMPNGGIITITASNKKVSQHDNLPVKPGRYIMIKIKDQGVGIPNTNLSKIFDAYFTTKQTGSGLGLATAYTIIQKHDGHIAVESEPGNGTAFIVYLPASHQLPQTTATKAPDILTSLGHGHILVIDDDEMVTDLLSTVLANFGYTTQVAANGEMGVELYQQAISAGTPFDLVITDLTIPGGMGGQEVITNLRKIDPHVAAIVSSGYTNHPVITNYQEYGFRGVLTKPYQIEKLSELLHEILDEDKQP